MKKKFLKPMMVFGAVLALLSTSTPMSASSHREAPLVSNDPLADNTDLYAFRSPDDTNTVTIIANYIPFEAPFGGPNYFTFGENIRYEIHIKNGSAAAGDDIVYRFTFTITNEDPTTFFNIRAGKQNQKATYKMEKSVNGGASFTTVLNGAPVPPNNIGPRSIEGPAGLATTYAALESAAIKTASSGEKVFCGPVDDPFFVDLGGIFDLGQTRAGGTGVNAPKDGLAKFNCHSIAIKIPISMLQKNGKTASQKANILDSDFIIGVWASASRPAIRTFKANGVVEHSGDWVQVSRLGMPLTNEAVIPIGSKDKWNSLTPYTEDPAFDAYFSNPELALYMDDSQLGTVVPALSSLRIQSNSLQSFDFRNGKDGLYPLLATNAGVGTALDTNLFGKYLLRSKSPRSVDILPIFHTGVPNLPPYQLATGKNGNPLAVGKPFINNFLPTFGDMLRLNMAVPVTARDSKDFSSLGIIQAAVLGLTDARFNTSTALQFIPNMDGFPNGRRLEDDVTRIELQAVSGVALAAIGLWYNDYTAGDANPVTTQLLNVLTYTTGVEQNDTTFKTAFPYVQTPWEGYKYSGLLGDGTVTAVNDINMSTSLNASAEIVGFPNPFTESIKIKYAIPTSGKVVVKIQDVAGNLIRVLTNTDLSSGAYETTWVPTSTVKSGMYIGSLSVDGKAVKAFKIAYSE